MTDDDDAFLRYCIDNATFTWGTAVDGELEAVEGKNKDELKRKRSRVLEKWLGIPQKFRNPTVAGSGIEQQHTVKGDGA